MLLSSGSNNLYIAAQYSQNEGLNLCLYPTPTSPVANHHTIGEIKGFHEKDTGTPRQYNYIEFKGAAKNMWVKFLFSVNFVREKALIWRFLGTPHKFMKLQKL